jgi:type IV pilus assembly protein PilB
MSTRPLPAPNPAGKGASTTSLKLGDLMVREGLLTMDGLQKALAIQKQSTEYKPLGRVCVELKLISKQELQRFLSKYQKHIQIGELLVNMGLINDNQVQKILEQQRVSSKRFGALLIQGGYISESQLTNALSLQLDIPRIVPSLELMDLSLMEGLEEENLRYNEFLPINRSGNQLTVLMSDPLNITLLQQLVDRFKCKIIPAIATPSEILSTIAEFFGPRRKPPAETALDNDLMLKAEEDKTKEEVSSMARYLVRSAVEEGATALHVECQENYVRVRLRKDGVMQHKTDLPARVGPGLIDMLKTAFRLKGGKYWEETISTTVANRKVDLSISSFNGIWGENLVVHLLYAPSRMLLFDNLGFSAINLERLMGSLERSGGIVIMGSPIRSGKSTLMYASLLHLNQLHRSVLSLEKFVHYTMPGVIQNHFKTDGEDSFSSLVEQMAEYDSDIMMVEEIHNPAVAESMNRAALMGKKVLTSLYAADTTALIYTLMQNGNECLLTSPVPVTLVTQRLIRQLCEKCRIPYSPSEAELVQMKVLAGDRGAYQFYTAKGCPECRNQGYNGLTAIHETLEISEDIRNAVLQKRSATTIRDIARREANMVSMVEDGVFKASVGITSLDEVRRVTLIHDIDSKTSHSIKQINLLCSGTSKEKHDFKSR